jgi:hypothetical protein
VKKQYTIAPSPKPSNDGLAAMGRQLVTRAVSKIAAVVTASPEERAQRLSICNTCHERKSVQLRDKTIASVCGKCGCICEAKAAIKAFNCPIGKW